MRVKASFVTNSSTTSFIIIGNEITKNEAVAANWKDITVVADEGYVFEVDSFEDLKEFMKDYFGIEDEDEIHQFSLRCFKSLFYERQYNDSTAISEIKVDIPKGTKFYTFPCAG